jgi:hypothetical protein
MSPFPLDLLPQSLQQAIAAQVTMANYPVEAVGTAALAVVSHAAQALHNVDCLHTPGVTYPLCQLFMVLARSGDAKSSLFERFMAGIRRWQARQRIVYDGELAIYNVDRKLWDANKVKAEKAGKRDELLGLQRAIPRLPRNPDNVLSKSTGNGLFRTLETGWPALGIFTGEGGSFLGGHSLRTENSPVEFASILTTLWDGGTIDRTTGEVTMRLPGRRLSGLIMAQQEVAEGFLTNPLLKAHGVHARFLIVNPPPWQPHDADFMDATKAAQRQRLESKMEDFHATIERMLSALLPTAAFDDRVLEPPTIYWSPDATAHMERWNNTVALPWRREHNEPFFNRAFEHACRLAGVLAVFDEQGKIELDVALAATALVEFYADQLRGLDLGVGDSRNSDEAPYVDKLAAWFRKQTGPVTMREISRTGPNAFRKLNSAKREGILKAMERDEYIAAVEVTKGGTKSICWRHKT